MLSLTIQEVRSEMYDVNHLSTILAIRILYKRDMRRLWSIVSNSELRLSEQEMFHTYY